MARRPFALLAVLACLIFGSGCGHEARVAIRNVEEAGKFLATQGPDDLTRAIGRSIAMQSGASADQMDLLIWGLMARHTAPTISAQDWADSPAAAERRSEDQARKVERETARIQAISGTIFENLGLASGLTGTGVLGLGIAWLLRNRGTIMELKDSLIRQVQYTREVEEVADPKKVAKVKDKYRPNTPKPIKEALAKVPKPAKVP